MGAKFAMFPGIEPEVPLGRDGGKDVDGTCEIIGLDNIAGFRDGFGGCAMEMAGKEDCIGGGADTSGGPGGKGKDGWLTGALVNRGPDCPVAKEADMFGGAEELNATTGRGITG